MHEHNLRRVSGGQARSGAAGIGLLLGGGAVYLLERASTEALAATSSVLLTTGLAGLVLMAVVVAVRLLTHRPSPGGGPPGDRIFLVRDAGELRPIPLRVTGGPMHERRRSA